MSEFAKNYYDNLFRYIQKVKVTETNGIELDCIQGIKHAVGLIKTRIDPAHKIIFIGNGGSAAISSHMATDFWKTGGIRAVSFNDGAQLTCLGNDYGYRHVFEKPIAMFADAGDILIAISSSGRSENILLGVPYLAHFRKLFQPLSGKKRVNKINNEKRDYEILPNSKDYS